MEQLEKIEPVEVKVKPTQTTSEKLMPIPPEAKPESKLKRFWKILDGNKTIIGSITLTVISVVPIPEPYKTASMTIVSLLTGAALTSHIKKGYFTANKGH